MGHLLPDHVIEVLPLPRELCEVVARGTQGVAIEEIRLVAQLEGDQLVTHGAHHEIRFGRRGFGSAGTHIQAINQLPARRVDKAAQIAHRLRRGSGLLCRASMQVHAERLLQYVGLIFLALGCTRLRGRFGRPVGVFAAVAADAQHTGFSQAPDEADQFGVVGREEVRIAQL